MGRFVLTGTISVGLEGSNSNERQRGIALNKALAALEEEFADLNFMAFGFDVDEDFHEEIVYATEDGSFEHDGPFKGIQIQYTRGTAFDKDDADKYGVLYQMEPVENE